MCASIRVFSIDVDTPDVTIRRVGWAIGLSRTERQVILLTRLREGFDSRGEGT
jgi:hypothetical protein